MFQKIKYKLDTVTPYWLWVFLSTVFIGLFCHGFILSNKISYHDDIYNINSVGGTFPSGRWMLGCIGKVVELLFGVYSSSWLLGLLTIFLIACTAVFLTGIFSLERTGAVLTGGILVSFPFGTSLFSAGLQ